MRYGSVIYDGCQPSADAACVALARAAGAVVLGKTVTTEFAYFSPGPTANPHNLAHTPGGVVQRLRGRSGRWYGAAGVRHTDCRLADPPRLLLWRICDQTHFWLGESARCQTSRTFTRHVRLARTQCGRPGADAMCA